MEFKIHQIRAVFRSRFVSVMDGSCHTQSRRLVASFEGRVQGVGFRFTTVEIARNYSVSGYVQNMTDGTVKLVVEGAEKEVEDMLAALRQSHVHQYVTREHIDWQVSRGDMTSFEIRYA